MQVLEDCAQGTRKYWKETVETSPETLVGLSRHPLPGRVCGISAQAGGAAPGRAGEGESESGEGAGMLTQTHTGTHRHTQAHTGTHRESGR